MGFEIGRPYYTPDFCNSALFEMDLDERDLRILNPIIEEINEKCVRMEKSQRDKYRLITELVVNDVIQALKFNNEVFRIFFSRLGFVGSYFDGLRVKEATEFDINVIAKLPLNYKKIKVENTNAVAGYARVNILEARKDPCFVDPVKRVIDKWCDSSGYIQQNEVRKWLEGALTKVLGYSAWTSSSGYTCQWKKTGPAFTLLIDADGTQIDVDLVFTLEFPGSIRPPTPFKWPDKLADSWILVPKPVKDHPNENILWRISFPNSEKKLMCNLNKLKLMNRFMKALRDAERMNLPSYYIKTIFLWEADEVLRNERKKLFWQKSNAYLFVYCIGRTREYLEAKKLPYYWHAKCNLLAEYDYRNLEQMANRFRNIVNKIVEYIKKNDKGSLRIFMFNLFNINQSEIYSMGSQWEPEETTETNASWSCSIM